MAKYTDTIKIKGEIFWAYDMTHPPTKFNPDNKRFQVTIGNLTKEDQEKLKSIGCKIKNNDRAGDHIVAKSTYEIVAFDKQGKKVDSETIGNGTKVNVELNAYEHRMTPAHGMAPSVKKLTVTDLIIYNREAAEELDDVL